MNIKYTEKSKLWYFDIDYDDEDKMFKVNKNVKICNMITFNNIDNMLSTSRCSGFIELYQPENIVWMKINVHPIASFRIIDEKENKPKKLCMLDNILSIMCDAINVAGNMLMQY